MHVIIYRGDFEVWFRQDVFTHIFPHLSDGFQEFVSLSWSEGAQEQLYTNPSEFVYSRMLLSKYCLICNCIQKEGVKIWMKNTTIYFMMVVL